MLPTRRSIVPCLLTRCSRLLPLGPSFLGLLGGWIVASSPDARAFPVPITFAFAPRPAVPMRSERLRAEAELGLAARFGDVVWGFGSEHRSGNHGGEMVTTILNAHVDDAASWTPPRPLADGDGPYRHPCYFLDENRAWCVLAADFDNPIVIFATSDAGASWTPSGLGADEYTNWPEAPVVSIAFRDARRGTVKIVDEPCHHNGHIESTVTYTTRDGGLHWTFAGRTSTCLPPEDHCRGG